MSEPKATITIEKELYLGGGKSALGKLCLFNLQSGIAPYIDWSDLLLQLSSSRGHSHLVKKLISELLIYNYVLEVVNKGNEDELTISNLKTIFTNAEEYSKKLLLLFTKELEEPKEPIEVVSQDILL